MPNLIIHIFYWLFFAYFALTVLYLLAFSMAGNLLFSSPFKKPFPDAGFKRIAVLIPAYKEDLIIRSSIQHMLKQDYPDHAYDVYLIADSFRPETLAQLHDLRVSVLEVSFDKSTKTKSLNAAFERITGKYDVALISDADNIPARDYLQWVNLAFTHGAKAVQGQRVAKNLDSSFAILDACSEAINNHIFRKGANAVGLSSSIIGSGMAFEYPLIRKALGEISAVGGFDKVLQLKIVKQGIRIHYLEQALVFDEKVDNPNAFKQQRSRWVSSQFIYLKQFLLPGFGQLLRGNFSYFNLAFINNIIVPRAFLFILLPLFAAVSFLAGTAWGLAATGLWLVFCATMLLSLPRKMYNRELGQALLRIPGAIGMMAANLLHIRKANKTFIHTVHSKTEVTNSYLSDEIKS